MKKVSRSIRKRRPADGRRSIRRRKTPRVSRNAPRRRIKTSVALTETSAVTTASAPVIPITPRRLVFLGSGGARYVVFRQLRASGGIWLEAADTRILIDPGPGSLVRLIHSHSRLDPRQLDAVVISHRHLDHAADVNVIVESMTMGGLRQHGRLFAPADALEGNDPVVLRYLRPFLDDVATLRPGGDYEVGPIKFTTPQRLDHRVETYGFIFRLPARRLPTEGELIAQPANTKPEPEQRPLTVSYVSDTRFREELAPTYRADLAIINVVRLSPAEMDIDHLSIPQVKTLLKAMRPHAAVLTHFGMSLIRAEPTTIAERLSDELGFKVIAARDGMVLSLDEPELYGKRK